MCDVMICTVHLNEKGGGGVLCVYVFPCVPTYSEAICGHMTWCRSSIVCAVLKAPEYSTSYGDNGEREGVRVQ